MSHPGKGTAHTVQCLARETALGEMPCQEMTWNTCFSHGSWGRKREKWVDIHLQWPISMKGVTNQNLETTGHTRGDCSLGCWAGIWICNWIQCSLNHYGPLKQWWAPACGLLLLLCIGCISGLEQQEDWYRLLFHEALHLSNTAGLVTWVLTPSKKNKFPLWASNRSVISFSRA